MNDVLWNSYDLIKVHASTNTRTCISLRLYLEQFPLRLGSPRLKEIVNGFVEFPHIAVASDKHAVFVYGRDGVGEEDLLLQAERNVLFNQKYLLVMVAWLPN